MCCYADVTGYGDLLHADFVHALGGDRARQVSPVSEAVVADHVVLGATTPILEMGRLPFSP